jgi:hypothetical protein
LVKYWRPLFRAMRWKEITEETANNFVTDFTVSNRSKAYELPNVNLCVTLLTIISDIFDVKIINMLDEVNKKQRKQTHTSFKTPTNQG